MKERNLDATAQFIALADIAVDFGLLSRADISAIAGNDTQDMEQRLSEAVDLRVALVSYFVHVNRRFRNPTIIEMRLFEQARASAFTDELTGLRNYRYFKDCLSLEISKSEQF